QTAHLPSSFFYITLQFLPYWERAVVFSIFGVGLLVVSYLKLTQSVLGPFLPGTNTGSVVEVIHAFRLRGRGPRIVAIGGGTGLSSLLRGLKTYTSNLSAIVTVADDGGSSGRLRDEYRILPPGDFRQCLIALADAEPLMKQLFDHRFKEGSLNGHSFGNLFIMAMADVTGNFELALRESGKILAVKGNIVPSTLQDVTLVASINASPALKVLVCNLASQHGETDDYGVDDYIRVIYEHVGGNVFDFVLVNSNNAYLPTGGQSQVVFRADDASRHPEVRFIAGDV